MKQDTKLFPSLCSGKVAPAWQLSPSSSSLVSYKILINEDEHEDEDEKNQIRSLADALRRFLFSAFRIPTSEFLTPDT
jgi:hypothetical protein